MLTNLDEKFNIRRVFDIFVININPNIVTFLALIAAIIAGFLFYNNYIVLASLFVLLNGFLDVLDGQIAKKFGTSKLGDFLDHTVDRLADIAIFGGLMFSEAIPLILGLITLLVVLLVSYLGTQYQAITHKRLYGGILGRADRIAIVAIAGLFYWIYPIILYFAICFIFSASLITFLQRFLISYGRINRL